MRILRPIETITTEDLLSFLENLLATSGFLGFIGGFVLATLLKRPKGDYSLFDIAAAISALVLLAFLFFMHRYLKRTAIPELRERCQNPLTDRPEKTDL